MGEHIVTAQDHLQQPDYESSMRTSFVVLLLLSCKAWIASSFSAAPLMSMRCSDSELLVATCQPSGPGPSISRRNLLLGFGIAAGVPPLRDAQAKTPVRAPLPGGPPNPIDKQKLIDSEALIEGWGSKLKDPTTWPEIAEAVSKTPLSPESLDELFRYAAKNLPPNNLLGTDAGLWAGLKVESVQAMENFASEITYLVGESKKGSKSLDSTDLISYHAELVTKMKVAPICLRGCLGSRDPLRTVSFA